MTKTTRDEINLDLDGTIDAAIKKLTKLKKQYPCGRLNLTSDHEYGESYPRLKLEFTRPKEPIELEYDKWREKQRLYGEMQSSARAYRAEGDAYPRAAELEALKEELGCFAEPMGMLRIYDNEIVVVDMVRGGRRRDGTWLFRTMMADQYDEMMVEAMSDSDTKHGDAQQGSASGE